MRSTNLRQKITLIVFGILFTLIALETVLRFGGAVYLSFQEYKNREHFQTSDFQILCLGESTTYDGSQDSYPYLLEEILRKEEKKAKVINKGVPGIDSNFILEHAQKWISGYRPDLVVVMMGINDPLEKLSSVGLGGNSKKSFWQSFRIVKLAILIDKHLQAKFKQKEIDSPGQGKREASAENIPAHFGEIARAELRQREITYKLYSYVEIFKLENNYVSAQKILEKLLAMDLGKDTKRYLLKELGDNYIAQENYSDLMNLIDVKLKAFSGDQEAFEWISWLIQNKIFLKQVEYLLKKHVQDGTDNPRLYDDLAAAYDAMGQHELAREYRRESGKIDAHGASEHTKNNFARLDQLLHMNKIPAIYVQYPLLPVGQLRETLAEAGVSDPVLVDNEDLFSDAISKEGYDYYFRDRFAGNLGHTTRAGSRLLAQNIARVIMENFSF